MKLLITTAAAVICAAGMASAGTTIGASVNGGSTGIMNNATTVYRGASMNKASESAVNSASNVQAGFLNSFQSAQAGDSGTLYAGSVNIHDPVAVISTSGSGHRRGFDNQDGGGGSSAGVSLAGMFKLMNTNNSIGKNGATIGTGN